MARGVQSVKFPSDMIYSLLNFLRTCAFIFLWYKILVPWQHWDYHTLTALSLELCPHKSGQLSTIIPNNHGITITYIILHILTILYPDTRNVKYMPIFNGSHSMDWLFFSLVGMSIFLNVFLVIIFYLNL